MTKFFCMSKFFTFFCKNFVKAMGLLKIKKLLNSWFDEIFFGESFFIFHAAVISLFFWAKIVKLTLLLNKLLKRVNLTKYLFGKSNFFIFPHSDKWSFCVISRTLMIMSRKCKISQGGLMDNLPHNTKVFFHIYII